MFDKLLKLLERFVIALEGIAQSNAYLNSTIREGVPIATGAKTAVEEIPDAAQCPAIENGEDPPISKEALRAELIALGGTCGVNATKSTIIKKIAAAKEKIAKADTAGELTTLEEAQSALRDVIMADNKDKTRALGILKKATGSEKTSDIEERCKIGALPDSAEYYYFIIVEACAAALASPASMDI